MSLDLFKVFKQVGENLRGNGQARIGDTDLQADGVWLKLQTINAQADFTAAGGVGLAQQVFQCLLQSVCVATNSSRQGAVESNVQLVAIGQQQRLVLIGQLLYQSIQRKRLAHDLHGAGFDFRQIGDIDHQ